jgi:hypothetical protein
MESIILKSIKHITTEKFLSYVMPSNWVKKFRVLYRPSMDITMLRGAL